MIRRTARSGPRNAPATLGASRRSKCPAGGRGPVPSRWTRSGTGEERHVRTRVAGWVEPVLLLQRGPVQQCQHEWFEYGEAGWRRLGGLCRPQRGGAKELPCQLGTSSRLGPPRCVRRHRCWNSSPTLCAGCSREEAGHARNGREGSRGTRCPTPGPTQAPTRNRRPSLAGRHPPVRAAVSFGAAVTIPRGRRGGRAILAARPGSR